MENAINKVFRTNTSTTQVNNFIKQTVSKKRPKKTKLDLEKLFQQSISLTETHNKLLNENQKLKEQLSKVEQIKINRQNLISTVEKIVQEKSGQLINKSSQSWLVYKLNKQINQLKTKIQQKQKIIRNLKLNKENQTLRQKQIQISCFQQILEWVRKQNINNEQLQFDEIDVKQAVWMEEYAIKQQQQLAQIQSTYQQEKLAIKKLMEQLAIKKVQLKNIRQMEDQYYRAQERYKQERKLKQNKLSGNKRHMSQLLEQKNQQQKKLEDLKIKFKQIQQDQNQQIKKLEQQLASLQKQYLTQEKSRNQLVLELESEDILKEKQEKWAKHISENQVIPIAANLNKSLALKRISLKQCLGIFFQDGQEQYSIHQIAKKLKGYPFQLENDEKAYILARYVVEDSNKGLFLLDLSSTQTSPIIRSILSKIIGQIEVYTPKQQLDLLEHVSDIMGKFHALVAQIIETKYGQKVYTTKQKLIDAIQCTQLELSPTHIGFILLYLFSWAKDVNKLEISRLSQIGKIPMQWYSNSSIKANQTNH